jgi:hypothetical protein
LEPFEGAHPSPARHRTLLATRRATLAQDLAALGAAAETLLDAAPPQGAPEWAWALKLLDAARAGVDTVARAGPAQAAARGGAVETGGRLEDRLSAAMDEVVLLSAGEGHDDPRALMRRLAAFEDLEFARRRLAKRLATLAHLPASPPLLPAERAALRAALPALARLAAPAAPGDGPGDAPAPLAGAPEGAQLAALLPELDDESAERAPAALAAAGAALALGRELLRRAAAPPAPPPRAPPAVASAATSPFAPDERPALPAVLGGAEAWGGALAGLENAHAVALHSLRSSPAAPADAAGARSEEEEEEEEEEEAQRESQQASHARELARLLRENEALRARAEAAEAASAGAGAGAEVVTQCFRMEVILDQLRADLTLRGYFSLRPRAGSPRPSLHSFVNL